MPVTRADEMDARPAETAKELLAPMTPVREALERLNCQKCAGEGTIYTSRYGGNDPDVYPVGKCEACDGSGDQVCEARGCSERAVAFNDDGEALCEDCLMEWQVEAFGS